MDAGLQIKELAEMLGVTPDTIINWELRRMNPRGKKIRENIRTIINVPVAF
jgi:DNA-binding transcriptional regulator YiaG